MSDERWRHARIARDKTHHLVDGAPMYAARFDEVLKFHPPGLAPVRLGSTAWHIDERGNAAYSRRFIRTFGFYEGIAAVQAQDGWHHIVPDGRDLYSTRHAWCGNFQGGHCTVRGMDGRYQHFGNDGQAAYRERWRYAGDYRDGIAVVQRDDGRSTHVDESGTPVNGKWFLDLDVFHKGFARARDERGWLHVDIAGRPLYERRFTAVEPFYNGQARVEGQDGSLEVIAENGDCVLALRPPLGLSRCAEETMGDSMAQDCKAGTAPTGLRVLLIGLPGAGKSTLAAALKQQFGLPLFEIDEFRRQHSDGTVAGDCFARAHFLRACGKEPRGIFEFSAVGVYRFDTANALREQKAPLLTVWVDAAPALREERLARRGGRIPWPRYRLDASRQELEEKGALVLREDYERGFWTSDPGWQVCRLDTGNSVKQATLELVRRVEEFMTPHTASK